MFRILSHLILGILSLFFIFPFIWIVITSFKPENELFDLAQKINSLNGKIGVYFGETDTCLIFSLNFERGGNLINEKGKIDFNNKA